MFTIIYNSVCRESGCDHYIEWEFDHFWSCSSCTKIGQSHDINQIPDDCDFKERLEKWKEDHEKQQAWFRLQNV